jgi:hypothetical protein
LRPLNLGDVLDGMFRLARDHWRAFAIGLGVVVVPLALLSHLLIALTFGTPPGFIEMLQNPDLAEEFVVTPADVAGFGVATLLSVLAGVLVTPLMYGTAVHIATVGYRTGQADPMASLRAAAGHYWALLGASVLRWLLPLLILMAPLLLVAVGAGVGVDALTVIGLIGLLASAVVAIIAVIRIAFAMPAIMVEQLGPVQALRRSNALVKGKTGMVFLTLLVVYIIIRVIGFVLAIPFGAIGGGVGNAVGAVINAVGEMLVNLVNYALLGGALVLMYFDRRVRTEGFDLTELADELGARETPSW